MYYKSLYLYNLHKKVVVKHNKEFTHVQFVFCLIQSPWFVTWFNDKNPLTDNNPFNQVIETKRVQCFRYFYIGSIFHTYFLQLFHNLMLWLCIRSVQSFKSFLQLQDFCCSALFGLQVPLFNLYRIFRVCFIPPFNKT